ncbi:ABC transporter ATP-binding protein [Aureimonas populi]|uniref:ABC transporter ATP-binding protein n=1 Tax=Aureimonas populi TaxID=1701758 RepID=A0ABW5CI11_9HYPH|nr:ABC transporter ATP-binding protein [Aureimonas populi]
MSAPDSRAPIKRRSRPKGFRKALPGLTRVASRLRPYLKPHRTLLGGGLAALLLSTLFRILEPWPLKLVVDNVLGSEPLPAWASTRLSFLDPAAGGATALMAVALVALVFVVVLRAVSAYAATLAFAIVGNRVVTRLRSDLFAHLQALPLAFHVRARVGDLTMRLMSDIAMARETAVTAFLPLMGNALILAALGIVMLVMNWRLALIALAPLPLVWLMTVRRGRRIQETSRKLRKREGQMAAAAGEALAGIRSVQVLGLETRVGSLFETANKAGLKQDVAGKRLSAGLERRVEIVAGVATAAVIFFGARMVLEGALTLGGLLVFLTYLRTMLRPVRDLAKFSARLAKASAAGERILDVLDVSLPGEPEGAQEMARPRGELSFEKVRFAYEPGRPVLEGLDLSIRPGEIVAVMGPSGSGKSTIADLALRLADPDEGTIRIDGQPITQLRRRALRGHMAVVLQDTVIFAGTIRDNVAVAQPEASEEAVLAALEAAGLRETVESWPEGIDTPVGEGGADLSGGQRQRIAIARAALSNAPILILDEPTTGLDRRTREGVVETLLAMAKGRSTLLITHEADLAARATRVLVLEEGKLVEERPPMAAE